MNSALLAALTPEAAPLLHPCFFWKKTVTFSSNSSNSYISTVIFGHPSANPAFPPHPRLQTLTTALCSWLFLYTSCFLFPPNSLRVLQWNAGGLRARSTKLLHSLSSHPVDLICIQKYNLNSSSSSRIPGFYALRSDRTHSRSGIFSPDATHASSGVIFVR